MVILFHLISDARVLQDHREGWSGVGSPQAGAGRLRHQEAAGDVRRRGREGLHRRALRADSGVRGLRPVSRHQLHVENIKRRETATHLHEKAVGAHEISKLCQKEFQQSN